jgi:hypothetical protein
MEEDLNQSAESPLFEKSPAASPLLSISPLIEYYQPPRLGIIHLLAWVTVAAILMKFNVAMEMLRTPTSSESKAFQLAQQILMYSGWIIMAAMLVGGGVFYNDRFRRKKGGPLQPGHWLIAINGVAVVFSLILWAAMTILQSTYPGGMFTFRIYFILYGILYFGMSIACFRAAKRLAERGRWRWVMVYMTIENGGRSGLYLLSMLYPSPFFMQNMDLQCCGYPLMALLLVAMVTDLVKRIPRDWLHWLGAFAPIAGFALNILWHILYTYLRNRSDLL